MPDTTLPGYIFIDADGGLKVTPSIPTTDRVLIIGTALDGPVNRAVPITSMSDAEALFGPVVYSGSYLNPVSAAADSYPAGNTLIKNYHEVLLGGGGNVYLCRVGGTTAAATGGFTTAYLSVAGRYPGRIYNGLTVAYASGASTATITITQPVNKGATLTYSFANATPLQNVANVINNDINNRSVTLNVPSSAFTTAISTLTPATVTLFGGTNGTKAPGEDYASDYSGLYSMITDATSGTFAALADAEFDMAVMAALYGDDCVTSSTGAGNANTKSIANDFVTFLHNITTTNYPCHGVLLIRPCQKSLVTDLTNYANTNLLATSAGWLDIGQRWFNFGYVMNQGFAISDTTTGATVDGGRYLSVCAGPDLIVSHPDLGLYVTNGGAAYAGVISSLPKKDGAIRHTLGSVAALAGNFSHATHLALNQGIGKSALTRNSGGAAYVTFKNFIDLGQPGIIQDNTCALRGSDYQYLQIKRIVDLAQHLVRAASLPFLGKGMDLPTKSALKGQISQALTKLADAGALLGGEGVGFNFNIKADPNATSVGQILISLQLRPSIQLRFITVQVNVSQ